MTANTDKLEITRRIDDLDAAQFLAEHWQKKPLLIRNAFPGFESPLEPDELAGLACEEGVESRIVDARENFKLHHGPFAEDFFGTLGEKDWTLLVQDVEKHLPELASIIDRFDFIPRWRIDDLMISFAAPGGGVGPHVDAYDVFLLQAKGRRRWSIAEDFDPTLIEGIDLKVLKNFTPEHEWILEPGDMLYLPPNVAHDGVGMDGDCMTYSIGFRAPDAQGMVSDLIELVQQRLPDNQMYTDPDLSTDEAIDGTISPAARERARRMIRDLLAMDDAFLDRWFGRFVTEPKPWLEPERQEPLDAKAIVRRLRSGEILQRDTRSHLAWMKPEANGNQAILFVDGEASDVPMDLAPLLALICTARTLSVKGLEGYLADERAMELLALLHSHGSLGFIDEQ
ncbi:MAG: cupin domain-containing protein [Gammaproteobacteria bacterium]|nr:cupin domain-containing protein [Gammaproteobacteria bacterium]